MGGCGPGAPGCRRSAWAAPMRTSSSNKRLLRKSDDAAPVDLPRPDVAVPWVLTARSADALAGQAGRLAGQLGEGGIADVGWSLATTRSMFEHRAVVVGCGPRAADGGSGRFGDRRAGFGRGGRPGRHTGRDGVRVSRAGLPISGHGPAALPPVRGVRARLSTRLPTRSIRI